MTVDPAAITAPPEPAQRLAVLLSAAARIEPSLLRAVRLALLPDVDVGAESDLWFSDWVNSRSTSLIVLEPAILPALHTRLADWIESSGPGESRRLQERIELAHAGLSPTLRLQERVTWAALAGEPDPVLDRELTPALQALVVQGRDGIADWLTAAWNRLPAAVRTSRVGWQLAQVVAHRRPTAELAMPSIPAGITGADVIPIAGAVADVRLGVRRSGNRLTLGTGAADAEILVPDTDPRIVELLAGDATATPQVLLVPVGSELSVPISTAAIALRTGRGTTYRLDAPERTFQSDRPADLEEARSRYNGYLNSGDPADLVAAIGLYRLLLTGESRSPLGVAQLAMALQQQYLLTGDAAALDEAIALSESVAALSDVAGAVLAGAYLQRFQAQGSPEDRDRAVEMARRSIAGTPPEQNPQAALILAQSLLLRAEPADIPEILQVTRATLSTLRPEHPMYPAAALSRASALEAGYHWSGDSALLIEAIDVTRSLLAYDAEPDTSALRQLAHLLGQRFSRRGDPIDLDEAISHLRQAAGRLPAGSPAWSAVAGELSQALQQRFDHTGSTPDINEAIDAARRAVEGQPYPEPSSLALLGAALGRRFAAHGSPSDRVEAESVFRLALDRGGDQDPSVLLQFAGLLRRWRTGEDHSSEAEALLRAALSRSAPESLIHAEATAELTAMLADRAVNNGDREAGRQAMNLWNRVTADASAPLQQRIEAARSRAEMAWWLGEIDAALAGYETAIGLSPLLGGFSADSRRYPLDEFVHLTEDAASAAVAAGLPERALELLEVGRAASWTRLRDYRTALTLLSTQAPQLAADLRTLDWLLDRPNGRDTDRMAATRQWDTLVHQVRALPGFTEFLRPPQAASLLAAAVDGPVVVINLSRLSCDVLIVRGSGLTTISLAVSLAEATERVNAFTTGDRVLGDAIEIGSWLWQAIAAPVLDHLPDERRIWWCTSGPLRRVPMQLATRSRDWPPTTLVRTTSSSTTSLGALVQGRAARQRRDRPPRILVVADPTGHLPGARREAEQIAGRFANCSVLIGPAASRAAVLERLPTHEWIHFASTAIADDDNQFASGLTLADGILTIREISGQRCPNGEMVFLSTNELLVQPAPAEGIGLVDAFQESGFAHVIAPVNPMSDVGAARLTGTFYERLAEGEGIAEALHSALLRSLEHEAQTPVFFSHFGI